MKEEAKTINAIRRYAQNPDAIIKAGEMAEWRFPKGNQMSLRGAKVFCLLIQAAGVRITEDVEHSISFAELNSSFHISVDELESVVDELHSTIIKLKLTEDDDTPIMRSGPVLADAKRTLVEGSSAKLSYSFGPALRQAISNSNHWAVISKKAILAFQSKFSIRLYTIISLRVGLRKTSEVFLLEDLRSILGIVDGTYPSFGNFQQKVLAPALSELNQLAGFNLGYRPLKRGRSVVAVEFFWGVKDQEAVVEASKELERPKVGRKARREGKVELIAATEQLERHQIALALSKIGDDT